MRHLGWGWVTVPRPAQGQKLSLLSSAWEELKHFCSFVAEIKSVVLDILSDCRIPHVVEYTV